MLQTKKKKNADTKKEKTEVVSVCSLWLDEKIDSVQGASLVIYPYNDGVDRAISLVFPLVFVVPSLRMFCITPCFSKRQDKSLN
jgi:hypothetical protein